MPRVKNQVARKRRKRKLFKKAKGFYAGRKNHISMVKDTLKRAETFAFRDRKVKRRTLRRLWITRINIACRALGLTYSRFIEGLNKSGVDYNRRDLAECAVKSMPDFEKFVTTAKKALEGT